MSNPKPPKKSVTASELMVQLQQDPQYQVRMQQSEAQRQESIQRHRLAAEPVVQDLRNAGFDVENIDELRRSGIDYEAAIPLLLKWLPLIAESAVKDSIVRALSVPWARQAAARPLIGQFHAAPDTAADLSGQALRGHISTINI